MFLTTSPVSHLSHGTSPVEATCLAGHELHSVAPAAEYVLVGQTSHWPVWYVGDEALAYFPASHLLHFASAKATSPEAQASTTPVRAPAFNLGCLLIPELRQFCLAPANLPSAHAVTPVLEMFVSNPTPLTIQPLPVPSL